MTAPYHVYILHSTQLGRYYIGFTEDVDKRLDQHRRKVFKGSFTAKSEDWELAFVIPCESESMARGIEAHIKGNRSRRYIENLILYPGISERLRELYSNQ